jgi:hypothetical protein
METKKELSSLRGGAVHKIKMRIDFFVVFLMVLVFIPLILFFEVRFMTSTLLFFGVPSLYLFIRKPKQTNRLSHVLLVGMIASFVLDFLAEINGAWSWAPEGQLLFPNKLFGLIPIDVLIWYFFWILFTIIFYEHFFEHEKSNVVSKSFKSVLIFFFTLFVLVITAFYIDPQIIIFPYAYLYIGILGSIPFFIWFSKNLI